MHDEVTRKDFDATERQVIREKLLDYAAKHGIGVPELAKRMKAAHPRKAEVPVSTLQRFLGGTRTNPLAVELCYRFTENLTSSDTIAKLGERLSVFYDSGNGHEFCGAYYFGKALKVGDFCHTTIARGTKIEVVPAAGFCRVREETALFPGHAVYEGVLVGSGTIAVVMLKDQLADVARTYTLSRENDTLHAQGAGARFSTGVDLSEFGGSRQLVEPISMQLKEL